MTRNGEVLPFRIVCAEEFHLRGPQRWHWEWTQSVIREGRVPAAYLDYFRGYDSEDVALYLQELEEGDAQGSLYLQVYNEDPILSQAKIGEFLRREIDLGDTDFDRADLITCIREHNAGLMKAKSAVPHTLAWRHPDSRKQVGSVYRKWRIVESRRS